MKSRIIIATSFATTVIVLVIIIVVFALVNPTLAQSLPGGKPAAQQPSLADAHLALPAGGGAKIWNLLGMDMTDLIFNQTHVAAWGCLYYEPGSSSTTAYATVHLPDGATILWLRFYWRDWVDPYNLELQLRRYPYASMYDYEILSTIYSSGTAAEPREGYTEDASLSIPVDNGSFIYALYANLHYAEDDHKLCGVQIGYTEPSIFGSALPVIQK
jgi:hypothetical protein